MRYQTDSAAPEIFEYEGENARTTYTCDDIGTEVSGTALGDPGDVAASVFAVIMIIIDVITTIASLYENRSTIAQLGSVYVFPFLIAGTILITIGSFWFNRCLATILPKELGGLDSTPRNCMAGIVDEIQTPDVDSLFPWTTQHPSISVVIKNLYWPRFSGTGASYIRCNFATTVSDGIEWGRSMTVLAFFYNRRVCDVMAGAMTGGLTGGILGGAAGAWIGGAMAAVCAALILCALVALIVGAIIAAIGTLVGAAIGGAAAQGAVGDQTEEEEAFTWRVGQLVKIQGPTVNHAEFDGAKVFWHVDEELCESYGDYPFQRPPEGYSHAVPDWELTDFDEDGNSIGDDEAPCPDPVMPN